MDREKLKAIREGREVRQPEKDSWVAWSGWITRRQDAILDALRAALATADAAGFARGVEADGPYLIWSNEHRAWWRASRSGYTTYLGNAGRYSREEAVSICADARGGWQLGEVPPEMAVAERDACACEARTAALLPGEPS